MLEIKHLTKKFHHKTVLNDLSMSVKPGEIAFLLGSSGVGKSTLLRILNGLETFDSGSILLQGKPLSEHPHAVGMVFQQFNLFEHMTVECNITFALEKAAKVPAQEAHERARHCLQNMASLTKHISRYAPSQADRSNGLR